LTTRRLSTAGAVGCAAAMLLYAWTFGVSLDAFRPQSGGAPADSGGPAASATVLAAPGQTLPAGTSSRLAGSTGAASIGAASSRDASIGDASRGDLAGRAATARSEPATGQAERARRIQGAGQPTRDDLPPAAVGLARNASVSTAGGLRTAVPPADAVTGPVVGGRMQPERVLPPNSGDGSYRVAPGHDKARVAAGGRVIRYRVEVERGLPFDAESFAADVHRIVNDPRGWGRNGRLGFERVDHGRVQLIISLSSPRLTDAQCAPLRTFGRVSCWNGDRAVINARRWGIGADTYGRDLLSYREYLINHEVGHGLGYGHVRCPHPRWMAPVMVQQTKSLDGCRANPWPHPRAGRRR
jgi:Protein of unknown function (DUF3152)